MRLIAAVCSCVLFCGLSSHAVPALTFETEVSLGEVVAGDVGERVVELVNSGDAALHVSKVRACCGASAVLEMAVDNPRRPRVGVAYLSQRSCGDSPHPVSMPERRASVSEARLRLSAVSIREA